MNLAQAMEEFSNFVWSTPTALLLAGAGVLFTLMTRGIQFKALTHGLSVIRGDYDDPEDEGNISHFQALCAALSATIGLGNISGVAVAIASGGPGAIFWMWMVGFLGMATKFMTCSLATMYRTRDSSGTYRGGPMYYIELGLGKGGSALKRRLAKGLAILFAFLGVCGCIGAGTMFQSNQVAKTFVNMIKRTSSEGVAESTQLAIQLVIGLVLCLAVALVIIGGIKRIGQVASKLVPTMCLIYVAGALYTVVNNFSAIPDIFSSIFSNAFTPAAGAGAFWGVAVKTAVIQGVRRACFSNEAGMGTAPIAHATAKTDEPIREGIVAAVGPFVDTIIVCTMTALVILGTGTHTREGIGQVVRFGERRYIENELAPTIELEVKLALTDASAAVVGETLFVPKAPAIEGGVPDEIHMTVREVSEESVTAVSVYDATDAGRALLAADQAIMAPGPDVFLFRDGVDLTAYAFDRALSGFGTYFIPIAALLFAFSTMISWGFYGETCTEYLFGERAVLPFKFAFVAMIVVGTASMKLEPVMNWADGMLGLMMVPNMIGTLLLAPHVVRAAKDYFRRLSAGEFEEQLRRAAEARAKSS